MLNKGGCRSAWIRNGAQTGIDKCLINGEESCRERGQTVPPFAESWLWGYSLFDLRTAVLRLS